MLAGSNDNEKLQDLSSKNYKDQAVWFLNSFWNDFAEKEARNVWDFTHKFIALDHTKKAQGNELDELNAHRFLEQINETMTVASMRELLRGVGVQKIKYVPLVHYLIARYKANVHKLVNAVQGDNQEEVERAQQMLNAAQQACQEAEKRDNEARTAQQELDKALSELKAQEEAYTSKTQELTKKSEEGGAVSRNKAKAELAQHLAEDPLPLRRAKITTEAAHKKADKAAAAAAEALEKAKNSVAEAESFLHEVSSRSGSAKGVLWWMDQELQEARKYMPQKKGGITKS